MSDIATELQQELDELQAAYKATVDNWVAAIRVEEALASGNPMLSIWTNGKRRTSASTGCTRKSTIGSACTKTRCGGNFTASNS
jgi:hypothetical protein